MSRSMRITSVMLVLTLCLLTVACENLSQENFNKIKVGMSLQEVEKLLGLQPHLRLGGGMKNCTWGTADKHVKVQFVADKVAHAFRQRTKIATRASVWDSTKVGFADAFKDSAPGSLRARRRRSSSSPVGVVDAGIEAGAVKALGLSRILGSGAIPQRTGRWPRAAPRAEKRCEL